MPRLPRAFFARPAPVVARELIGCVLVHRTPAGPRSGVIIEAEAYRGLRDPASHAFRGATPRSAVMFGPPGHLYVYFTYGMHHCVNLVCESEGMAGAVLIRALEPLRGLEAMRRDRGHRDDSRLARGPGCVARALDLDRRHDGLDLSRGPVWVERSARPLPGPCVRTGPRIGIRAGLERRWRFWIDGHPGVSGRSSGGVPR